MRTATATPLLLAALSVAGACHAAELGEHRVEPFIWIAMLHPSAGGAFPVKSETLHLSESGRLQRSEETSDGRLSHLEETRHQDQQLFDLVHRMREPGQPNARPNAEPGVVPDYAPATVVVSFADAEGHYSMQSYPRDALPDAVRALVDHTVPLHKLEGARIADSGLYARAQRLPRFDRRVSRTSAAVTRDEARRDPLLRVLLENEMALVRVGDHASPVMLSSGVTLEPRRPAHIDVDERVYRIITFEYVN